MMLYRTMAASAVVCGWVLPSLHRGHRDSTTPAGLWSFWLPMAQTYGYADDADTVVVCADVEADDPDARPGRCSVRLPDGRRLTVPEVALARPVRIRGYYASAPRRDVPGRYMGSLPHPMTAEG